MGAITVANCPRRGKPNAEPKANVGFSSPHDIFPRQFAEKCVNVCEYSLLHVIPKRRTSREGSPRLLQPVPYKGIPRHFTPRNDERGEAGVMRRLSLRCRDRCRQRRRMRGQTKKQFPFFPPHQSLRDSFPPRGSLMRYQLCRKESRAFPPRDSVCAYLRASRKSEAAACQNVAKKRRRGKPRGQAQPCPRGVPPLTTLCHRSISQKDFYKSFLR